MNIRIRKLLFSISEELYKIFTNYAFLIVVFGTMLIIMSGTILTEFQTHTEYNLFQLLSMQTSKKKELMEMNDITFEQIFQSGTSGYLWMFAPVLASASFVVLICSAKKNNNIRFELYRLGKMEYIVGKCIASLICGGLVLSMGYVLFAIVIRIVLPSQGTLQFADYGKRILEMFFYGMTSASITYILSGFIRNKYLVLCLPFMMNYFWKTQLDRSKFMGNKIAHSIHPVNPTYVFTDGYEWKGILLFWTFVIVIGIILWRIALERRCDCGE